MLTSVMNILYRLLAISLISLLYGVAPQVASAASIKLPESGLPAIPATPLQAVRPQTDAGVRYDRISPVVNGQATYNPTLCNVAAYWSAAQVSVGGRASGNGADVCKVQAQTDDGALKFLTKWPLNNIHYPLTPAPAWAQFRFSVPQGHTASTLEYELSWYKLFGSTPTNCHPTEIDPATGQCKLDVSADWQPDVPAGLFLLWAKPGDSQYVVTGPHDPIEKIGYSGKQVFQAAVPEALRDVDEVVVTLLTYNQYTKACEKANPTVCTPHENESLELHSVALKTAKALNPLHQPAQQHPRILGHGVEWQAYWQPFEALTCVTSKNDSDWGSVFNVKNVWDKHTKGYSACKETPPSSLQKVDDAAFYLNPPANSTWNTDRALRVMFLLRQLKQCHTEGGSCLYSAAETQALQTAFIAYEMQRFDSVVWDWGYKCFDIGTEQQMKFWSIFVDVFWSDLAATDKARIDTKMGSLIDCYLQQYADKDWSIFNGNNWTPLLGRGAAYWAIAYYHEDPRAPDVMEKVLESMWLHRDFYLADGAYMEGIVEYTNVSYSSLREINNLMMQGFGVPLDSVRWERVAKTANWFLDFMAPDGAMVDFGDSWEKLGWYTLDPLHMLLWEEMTGVKPVGQATLDTCKVLDYFSNKWFVKGLDDPWAVQPSMARNWINLAGQCQRTTQAGSQVSLFADAVTGSLRQYLPGSNPLAQQEGLRFKQADQTYLAVSGTPADFPHRELDFGGLIWSAYGNRLLYDFGYGEIALTAQGKPYLLNDGNIQLFDNLPLGTNTLVVEDATQTGYTAGKYQNATINSSQIYGERGTLVQASIGNLTGLHLDAQAVYGANDAELGWLRYFDRWMLPLGDGNFLVADAFAVKADRGSADVQEYWHTAVDTAAVSSCSFSRQNVAMSLENTHSLRLKPECARLDRTAASSVVGRIAAASWQAGEFSIDPEIINYKTRINTTIQRQRARFKPLSPVSEDVRVFLLQAAPQADKLPDASLQKGDCGGDTPCFDLRLNGQTQRITFAYDNAKYRLASIQPVTVMTNFVDQKDVLLRTLVESNNIQISGLSSVAPFTVTGGEYRINGGAYTKAKGTLKNGDTLQVRHLSSSKSITTVTTTLKVGKQSYAFRSTTFAIDSTPDLISFTAQTGVALGSLQESNVVTLSGINVPIAVSVTGGEYRINGGAYTKVKGTVKAGDTLQLRQIASSKSNTTVKTTLTVGNVKPVFSTTTLVIDGTPDTFSFTALSGVTLNSWVESASITVSSINVPVAISITGGEYRVNDGTYTTAKGAAKAGDTLQVRHLSSKSSKKTVTTNLTVGAVKAAFKSTTQ